MKHELYPIIAATFHCVICTPRWLHIFYRAIASCGANSEQHRICVMSLTPLATHFARGRYTRNSSDAPEMGVTHNPAGGLQCWRKY